jgi:hypothetical protein
MSYAQANHVRTRNGKWSSRSGAPADQPVTAAEPASARRRDRSGPRQPPNREAIMLRGWMKKLGYTAAKISRETPLVTSVFYNYFGGTTRKLSLQTADILAKYFEISVEEVTSGDLSRVKPYINPEALSPEDDASPLFSASITKPCDTDGRPLPRHYRTLPVAFKIGVRGVLFDAEDGLTTAHRPAGIAADADVLVAAVVGDALHPLPAGWLVFFAREASDPETLIGKLAVVRHAGSPRARVRTIQRGTQPGLYRLDSITGAGEEDVDLQAAHRILSLTQPEA